MASFVVYHIPLQEMKEEKKEEEKPEAANMVKGN